VQDAFREGTPEVIEDDLFLGQVEELTDLGLGRHIK
jgi:hypothetical protein